MSKIIKILIILLALGGIYAIYELGFSECGDWYVKCQKESSTPSLEGSYGFSIGTEAADSYIGTLNIENMSTSSFMFDIFVAKQNGDGEIKGQAQIMDAKNAKAVVNEGGTTCELTFEVVGLSEPQSIKVNEVSDGCLQFHGANVQFGQTYTKQK